MTGNITVVYTYIAISEIAWYTDITSKCNYNNPSKPENGSFVYTNSDTLAACVGVPVNAIRLAVARVGVLSYGKVSATEYTKLGELTLENPSKTNIQAYRIPEVTLADGERFWVQSTSDTGLFYYGSKQDITEGNFAANIRTATSSFSNLLECLGIDFGYIPVDNTL